MCDVVAGQVIVYSNGRSWTSCQVGIAGVAIVKDGQWTSNSSSNCRSWTSRQVVGAIVEAAQVDK